MKRTLSNTTQKTMGIAEILQNMKDNLPKGCTCPKLIELENRAEGFESATINDLTLVRSELINLAQYILPIKYSGRMLGLYRSIIIREITTINISVLSPPKNNKKFKITTQDHGLSDEENDENQIYEDDAETEPYSLTQNGIQIDNESGEDLTHISSSNIIPNETTTAALLAEIVPCDE